MNWFRKALPQPKSDAQVILDALGKANDLNALFEAVDRMVDAGSVTELLILMDEIESNGRGERWVLESMVNHVEEVLALTPSPANARAALNIALRPRTRSTQEPMDQLPRDQRLASYLAAGQFPETLNDLLREMATDPRPRNLFACWVQELLIREGTLDKCPAANQLWSGLTEDNHPLSVLPLALSDTEQGLCRYLPHYRRRGSSCALPFGPSEKHAAAQGSATHPQYKVTSELPAPEGLEAAVQGWCDESNGVVEARVLQFEPALEDDASLSGFLCGLQLECLRDADAARIVVTRVDAASALETFFSAAASGGAYGGGQCGAFGRLRAWHTMRAMCGVAMERLEEVDRAARQCIWLEFGGPIPWFQGIAWDIGVAAVRPDRRTVAILAATDVD